MSFLDDMWENHRTVTIVLGVILFPIAIAIIGLKIYMSMQVNAAHKEVENAKAQDKVLSAQENELKKQADSAMNDANKAAQKVEDRHADDAVDMDWQNKRKD